MMLFPKDPALLPELWQALHDQLQREEMIFPIRNGRGDPFASGESLSSNEIEILVSRMKKAGICLISANRGAAISPHFSGKKDGRYVVVGDMIMNMPYNLSYTALNRLQESIEILSLELFYSKVGVDKIVFPINIELWPLDDMAARIVPEGIELRKEK